MEKMKTRVQTDGFDESVRYYRNARGLLGRCRVEDGIYSDIKPVREAFGTAWLAADHAIKGALRHKGLHEKQIPESWEPLRAAAVSHLAVHNGKLAKLMNIVYQQVHLEGYYRGTYWTPLQAREAFNLTRLLIEKLSGRKIA